MAVPKILHYCWFGKTEMPTVSKKCMTTWKKYFADYQWMRWDETNFDVYCNQYVKEAYCQKQYKYVSDYARLLALYEYGGIYLDVDCKVKKSFDNLLHCHAFTGFGADNKELAACTMAFEKKDPFIKECIDSYKDDRFILEDHSINTFSVNRRMSAILEKHGFIQNGNKQVVNDIIIYPMTYFCPLSMLPDEVPDCKRKNTYSMALWTNPQLKRERNLLIRFAHKTGINILWRKIHR